MTVNTPFPHRPATPNWSTRGEFSSGRWGSGLPADLGYGLGDASEVVGNVTTNLTDLFQTLYSNQPGMYTQRMADGSIVTYRQPTGSNATLPVGSIGGTLGANLQTSGGPGIGTLLLIGAVAFFVLRAK